MSAAQLDPCGGSRFTVLYVEDERDDATLLRLAFERAGANTDVQWVNCVQDAMDYLDGKGKYANREAFPQPKAVLLDLNLPGKSGFEFLNWLASSPHAGTPVLVCSSTLDPREHEKARAKGAVVSLVKPCGFEELTAMALRVRDCCAASSAAGARAAHGL